MSNHIEWAPAATAQPTLVDTAWVEDNADDGNDRDDVAILLDTGSSTVAIYGSHAELSTLAAMLVNILAAVREPETGPVALQPGMVTLRPLGEAATQLEPFDRTRVVVHPEGLTYADLELRGAWSTTRDLLTGQMIELRRAACGAGCFCAGEVRLAVTA